MRQLKQICTILFLAILIGLPMVCKADSIPMTPAPMTSDQKAFIQEDNAKKHSNAIEKDAVDVREIIFEHLGNSYEWKIGKFFGKEVIVPLPIMVYSSTTGWHFFMSNKLEENGGKYEGLFLAPDSSNYAGKLVEANSKGELVKPWDFSLTKVALALVINTIILGVIIITMSRWYKKTKNKNVAPKGFIGFMEMFIMMVNDDIIKDCVGPKYKKFSSYLLTAFFFIFVNNLMGLIPFFPGGVNVTGNITITFVLALCTFFAVNIFGTKTYWKDIFWPDVPLWLKVPIPMMPLIELLSIFTKPFALMIRLFANMLAGHMAMLVLTCLIFITASMGPAINGSMTIASVLFNIFMNLLELLVAFIQAYVFTMLSAVFIGLALEEHVEHTENKLNV